MRLRWTVSADALAIFDADPKLAKLLSPEARAALRVELATWGAESFTDRKLAAKRIKDSALHAGVGGSAVEKVLLDVLAVRDPDAEPVTDSHGNVEPDPDLRDNENVPIPTGAVTFEADPSARLASVEYQTAVEDYMAAEVLPYVADAWIDHTKTKIGYEIPLTRHFYKYVLPRPLAEIDAEIKQLESEIQALLDEVTE